MEHLLLRGTATDTYIPQNCGDASQYEERGIGSKRISDWFQLFSASADSKGAGSSSLAMPSPASYVSMSEQMAGWQAGAHQAENNPCKMDEPGEKKI